MRYFFLFALATLSIQANAHHGSGLFHWLVEPTHLLMMLAVLATGLVAGVSIISKSNVSFTDRNKGQ